MSIVERVLVAACSLWLALYGIYPAADPGHGLSDGFLVWLDYAVHLVGVVVLIRTLRPVDAA
jgi:hypothetical protein